MLHEVTGDSVSLVAYLGKVVLALVLLAVGAWFFVRFGRVKGWIQKKSDKLYIISSLPMGRDVFFILRCGPDVLGIISGSSGAKLICRWKYEEWHEFEEIENNHK